MPGIVEYPTIVKRASEQYGDLFASEPQRRHFGEYLTGIMIAERKTVLGIHREFAAISDQSCLNRFLTGVDWDVQALSERRIDLLQQQSETKPRERRQSLGRRSRGFGYRGGDLSRGFHPRLPATALAVKRFSILDFSLRNSRDQAPAWSRLSSKLCFAERRWTSAQHVRM